MQKQQKDPVCGSSVGQQSQHKAQHHQKQYNFCCKECMETFKKNPDKYAR